MSIEEIVSNIKWASRAACMLACSSSDMIDDKCKCGRDIMNILDTYAQEIAVEFAEEMERLKEEDGYEYQGDGTWLYDEGFAKKYITTPQLFQQFLTNKNENK